MYIRILWRIYTGSFLKPNIKTTVLLLEVVRNFKPTLKNDNMYVHRLHRDGTSYLRNFFLLDAK